MLSSERHYARAADSALFQCTITNIIVRPRGPIPQDTSSCSPSAARADTALSWQRCCARVSPAQGAPRHREKILSVAYQKYNAGQGEPGKDRTLIRLYKEDFDTFREKPVS